MELGPQNQNRDGFLVPNSIGSVYMDPLGTSAWTFWVNISSLHWEVEEDKSKSPIYRSPKGPKDPIIGYSGL